MFGYNRGYSDGFARGLDLGERLGRTNHRVELALDGVRKAQERAEVTLRRSRALTEGFKESAGGKP